MEDEEGYVGCWFGYVGVVEGGEVGEGDMGRLFVGVEFCVMCEFIR